jgi:3',5'-cyclic-nucleotide phosphodiesterase
MEADLGIPTALFATPTRETVELGKSQLNFMNMFAIPLFQGVTDIMPAMQFTVDELHKNIKIWTTRIDEAQQRKDNDDSATDGMFSPRAMSLAFPSDAANQQGTDRTGSISSKLGDALKSITHGSSQKSTTTLEGITESNFQDTSSKELSNGLNEEAIAEPNGAIEGEPLIPPVYSMARRSPKPTPSQLQLSYATVSAPGLLDHPSQDTVTHNSLQKSNGILVGQSLVTDAVVRDQQTPTPRPESKHHNFQRTSDITDSNNSAPGSHDWASQATSATTSKIPLSPSTRGTSIMSNDSTERPNTVSPLTQPPSNLSPSLTNTTASQSCPTLPATSEHTTATTAADPGLCDTKNGSGVTIIETMRSLARKSSRSRFRMSFWKKKTGLAPGTAGVPPLPAALTLGDDDEARGRSRGGEEVRGRSRGNESRGTGAAIS